MSVSQNKVFVILARAFGTLVLAAGFIVFITSAPFLKSETDQQVLGESQDDRYSLRSGFQLGTMDAPVLAAVPEAGSPMGLDPTLGLFNAQFFGVEGEQGFTTSEHEIPGVCEGAGQRFIQSDCPECLPLSDLATGSDMLIWQQTLENDVVIRSVSRDCIAFSDEGTPIVGALAFGSGTAKLDARVTVKNAGNVPLLYGARRIAALSLGSWSATYDEVARPSSALGDMASALVWARMA